jgi:hypothetical protein
VPIPAWGYAIPPNVTRSPRCTAVRGRKHVFTVPVGGVELVMTVWTCCGVQVELPAPAARIGVAVRAVN